MREKFDWGVRYDDGREVIDQRTKAGRDEMVRRKRVAWERQKRRCCLEGWVEECPGYLKWSEAMFEHEDGRGMNGGHRDDRIERPDKKTGERMPYNGVAHAWCNSKKGSVRMHYNGVP
jgi:hypothetical protein